MIKTVTIAGKPVDLKATGSTLIKYRNQFGRDLINDFQAVQTAFETEGEINGETFDIVAKLTYTMAKQADKTITASLEDWLDEFDYFPISEFAADVIMLWASSLQTQSDLKVKNV